MLRQKGKSNTSKTENITLGNKPEGNGERKKIKKISRLGKTIQTKLDIPKQRKQFYQQTGRDGTKTYQGRLHEDILTTG